MNDFQIICAHCSVRRKAKPAKDGGAKLPLGWKRRDGESICGECWRKAYILRALTFPIAEPLLGSWKELDSALREMWAQTTAASNWIITQCYVRDVRRKDEYAKLPAMPPLYLYPELRILFPALPPQSIVSLEQAMQRKYRAKRYEILWTSSSSLPNMRYPQPFPLHNQSWSVAFDDQNRPVLTARIGDKRWDLRLKSGARYWRQIAGLRRMEQRGELAIYRAHDGAILCKLVGWLRREPSTERSSTLSVRTADDGLLIAIDQKENRVWAENMGHLPGLIAQHAKRMYRFGQDQKAEQRPVASFAHRREQLSRKHAMRMNSVVQEAAAHLANFARRRRIATVLYDDSKRWLDLFPYFALEERIKANLDERGIAFVKQNSQPASGRAAEDSALSQAEDLSA